MTIWLWKISRDFTCARWLNHSYTSSPYNQMTIWFWRISPRLHLRPMTQPFEYEFPLEPNDHMIMKNLPGTSPAPDDSTIWIRVHLRTKWPYFYEKYPKTSPAPEDSTIRIRVHLRTKWPYDSVMNNFPETSPAPDDSTIRIRVHLRTKWPYDYEKSLRDFTWTR